MLALEKNITKNVKGNRLQYGLVYGSNPNRPTRWCNNPTGPTNKRSFSLNLKDLFNQLWIQLGLWGETNATKQQYNVRNYS